MIEDDPPARATRGLARGRGSELVGLFKALSDITRLRIMGLLSDGELCVGELEYLLGVSQTNVSRHLERLRTAGLVTSRKQAQWVYYTLSDEALERSSALKTLLTEEIAGAVECRSDREAFRAYKRSGMGCADLPNCRRNRPRTEGEE